MKFKKKAISAIVVINVLMFLSFFLPLATMRKIISGRGPFIHYVSGFMMLSSPLWPFILPYLLSLITFVISSFFYFKRKIIRAVNYTMLVIMALIGSTLISIMYGYGTLYIIVYLDCVTLMTIMMVRLKKEEVTTNEVTA